MSASDLQLKRKSSLLDKGEPLLKRAKFENYDGENNTTYFPDDQHLSHEDRYDNEEEEDDGDATADEASLLFGQDGMLRATTPASINTGNMSKGNNGNKNTPKPYPNPTQPLNISYGSHKKFQSSSEQQPTQPNDVKDESDASQAQQEQQAHLTVPPNELADRSLTPTKNNNTAETTNSASVAVDEEKSGILKVVVVTNDNRPSSWMLLTQFKSVIQRQLPEMPQEYIARIVYDRNHVSLCAIRKDVLVGGICYRPFESRTFAEIVFLAISATEQVKGYGSHLMNHLKDHVQKESKIRHLLTYADQAATGYFRKQGFSANITLDQTLWVGYVKDYMGAILMHCPLLPKVKYLEVKTMLQKQKAAIYDRIKDLSRSHIIYDGLTLWKENPNAVIQPYDIPGIMESGWTKEMSSAIATRPSHGPLYQTLNQLLEGLSSHSAAWPFQEPVNATQVPDYYKVITDPMDLKTMYTRLEQDYYTSLESFTQDFEKIGRNCRAFNAPGSNYVKLIVRLEAKFKQMLLNLQGKTTPTGTVDA